MQTTLLDDIFLKRPKLSLRIMMMIQLSNEMMIIGESVNVNLRNKIIIRT